MELGQELGEEELRHDISVASHQSGCLWSKSWLWALRQNALNWVPLLVAPLEPTLISPKVQSCSCLFCANLFLSLFKINTVTCRLTPLVSMMCEMGVARKEGKRWAPLSLDQCDLCFAWIPVSWGLSPYAQLKVDISWPFTQRPACIMINNVILKGREMFLTVPSNNEIQGN